MILFWLEQWYNFFKEYHISHARALLLMGGTMWSVTPSRIILLAWMFFFLNSANCCGSCGGTTMLSIISHSSHSSRRSPILTVHGLQFSVPHCLSSYLRPPTLKTPEVAITTYQNAKPRKKTENLSTLEQNPETFCHLLQKPGNFCNLLQNPENSCNL